MTGDQEVKVLAGVMRLVRAMNSETRPDQLYNTILNEIVSAVSCEDIELYIYQKRDEYPSHKVWREQGKIIQEALTREKARTLFSEREILVEAAKGVGAALRKSIHEAPACCALPLSARGRLQGLVALWRNERFTGAEVEMLTRLGEAVAAALAQMVLSVDEQGRQVRFLSKLSHELRSPLNAINGYLDLALSDIGGELNGQQREFMQRARSGSEYLYALMEDLLLLGRANTGQLGLHKQVSRLAELVENVVEELELTVKDASVQIELSMPPDLSLIYVDPIRMQQVIRNLLLYAIECARKGGVILLSVIAEHMQRSESGEEREHAGILSLCIEANSEAEGKRAETRLELTRSLSIARLILELHGGTLEQEACEYGRCILRGRIPVLIV
ncbi:GAF domain-containing sensor histidine kinase [Ktedonospora formicarum]|uniref:histidine kinase n=1 Tax=Ktedonospora formicarum TaxID=2778364 RepID=A0A8J3I267_9CHLR|nr:GAF domain-containing sensor histidine kinase [Ktedonospora formicarum]GHO44688.1 hypothetical protein KSX_28510 [Ktedonospora formicarum]